MTQLPQTPYDTVCVFGGFDPVHIGHLRLMQEAAQYGKLTVIINSDAWLTRKKGYVFMPFEEREEIVRGFACVHDVVAVDDDNGTVCEALRRLKPTYFANGGDRKSYNVPEIRDCKELNITPLWNMGGYKLRITS